MEIKSWKKVKFLIIGLVILTLIIFFLNFFQKEVKNFFYFISSPFQKFFWKTGDNASDFLEAVFNLKLLKSEADELRAENQKLLAETTELEKIKEENKFLREALEINLQKEFKLDLARIIGKDISSDFILIDRGEDDGIKKGMPVISSQKVLLGKVSEVFNNFSKVMLISSKESSFDAEIMNKDISGIVKGEERLSAVLTLIPQNEEISQGDIIVTSRLGGIFPQGLLIGKIDKVKKNDVESLQTAEIELAFDIKEADYLFIITD